jgi:hypothetical protein
MKRKATEESSGQLAKKEKMYPEAIHKRRLLIKATIAWRDLRGKVRHYAGMFVMDSGCSGPTLSKDPVTQENMLVVRRKKIISVTMADGSPMKGAGEYYTTPYCMRIGSQEEDISWEVAQIEENIAGYLPMSWLYLHNPDVEWDTGIIRWRSPDARNTAFP